MKAWKEQLKKNYIRLLVIALIALALLFLFGQNIKLIIAVSLLTLLASVSSFYQNFLRSPINFELIKFATIISGAAYGAAVGITVGIISTIASKIISEKLDHTALPSVAAIIVVAIVAAIFPHTNIVALGIWLVILYHAITVPVQLAFGGTIVYGLIYVGTNMLFNVVVFTRFAPTVLRVLG